VAGDPDFSECRHLCGEFSRTVSLVRLCQATTCGPYVETSEGRPEESGRSTAST
jgi:hypothetical protein